MDTFDELKNPHIGWGGEFAHPNSPNGGGGPGDFKQAGPLLESSVAQSTFPPPDSPVGKTAVPHNTSTTSSQSNIAHSTCTPGWFDKQKSYKISNAPPRTANIAFLGDDLNFAARVLYAESSGSMQLKDKDARLREKQAILNVKHFRLNRAGYPNRIKAMTFRAVCEAPNQFESVYLPNKKLNGSAYDQANKLKDSECSDFLEAIEAVRLFFNTGPDPELVFDNFRGGKGSRGTKIGLSRFWLSDEGKKLYEKDH